ncbi:hypothetical protein PENTCL1PPCAC_25712 [Pristionchus entomophagus]|uniref:Uncharacterized protein n=1 Tax=Pristionchus entomophagus TaxID=358040 RepID=A0AAV5UAS5_9BILA|nr:hypothetical protein PENTCL1PPCAC_25712 [Pristionchus entomophagus]
MTSRIVSFLLLLIIIVVVLASYENCRDEPSFEICADKEIDKIITDLAKDKWEAQYRTKMNECLTIHC